MGNDAVTLDVYRYEAVSHQDGRLFGLFIAPVGLPERMAEENRSVCWGEVPGMHPVVNDVLDGHSFERAYQSQALVERLKNELVVKTYPSWPNVYSICGYNPFEQLSPEDIEDEEDQ